MFILKPGTEDFDKAYLYLENGKVHETQGAVEWLFYIRDNPRGGKELVFKLGHKARVFPLD